MDVTDHIVLVDAHGIGYASHYKVGHLTKDNMSTGVVFGFLTRVLEFGLYFHTNRLVFCWDSPTSYRRDVYPHYKAHRTPKTEEEKETQRALHTQLDILRTHVLPTIGFNNNPVQAGVEADDIIAKVCASTLGNFTIVSSDQDLFQCLCPCVRIYNPGTKKFLTQGRFTRKYKLSPHQWVQVKQLAGCDTDNVAGVAGVGPDRAAKYIRGELNPDSKTYQAIKVNWATVRANYHLVHLPHPKTTGPQLVHDKFSKQGFKSICDEYGLASFTTGAQLQRWRRFFMLGV